MLLLLEFDRCSAFLMDKLFDLLDKFYYDFLFLAEFLDLTFFLFF